MLRSLGDWSTGYAHIWSDSPLKMPIVTGMFSVLVLVTPGLDDRRTDRAAAQEVVVPEPVRNALGIFKALRTFSLSWSQHKRATPVTRAKLAVGPDFDRPDFWYLVWQDGKMYSRRIEGRKEWKDAPDGRRFEFA